GTNCAVGFSAGKNAVSDSDIGTITKGQKSAIGSTMLFLSCNIMLESIHHYVGSHDGNASSIIGIFGSCLIGNGGKFPSSDCKFLLIHGKCRNVSNLIKIPYQWRGRVNLAALIHDNNICLGRTSVLIGTKSDIATDSRISDCNEARARQG